MAVRTVWCAGVLLLLSANGVSADDNTCDAKPIIATHTMPVYPTISQRLGEQGRTIVAVSIDATGMPMDVKLTQSSGARHLDDATVDHIKAHWKWQPVSPDCPMGNAPQLFVMVVWALGWPPRADTALAMPASDYPDGAIQNLEFGDTYLDLTVDKVGAVTDGRVVFTSGYPDLDAKAMSVMKLAPDIMKGKTAGSHIVMARWQLPQGIAPSNYEMLLLRASPMQ